MSMHEHDIMMTMCMDSSSSSSSTMQAMATCNQFDPFPLLDNYYDVKLGATGNLFHVPNCLEQVVVENGFYGDYGIVETGNKMGLERDFSSIPPTLESKNINEENIGATEDYITDVKANNNHFMKSNAESIKLEDMFGFGNHWQGENLRMGEWDLEGLMEDVSSFPFLDFQV